MGITGLIPFLEKASSKVHLKDIRGSTVAVDTYCWLHKGVFSCAEKLVRGEDTDQYVQYCLRYIQLLLSYDIKPILVFDGRHLPAKALTERRRRESRHESRKRAAELLRLGRIEQARSHMRRCVDVTHEMALRLIRECRQRNVDCIVAPYEADAQMAWLNKVNIAEYVITEDSDLTLFGARKIIFKLDLAGGGLIVESDKLHLAMGCSEEKYTFEKFRRMCILSGCDYLDSLPGIGLAKACKFMLMTEEGDMWRALKKLPQYLNMKNLEVDDEYIDSFLKAEATFKHMYIFNPLQRKMERLYALTDFQTEERYCSNAGTPLEDEEQALQLALGNLNPFNLKQLDNWHPDQCLGLMRLPPGHAKRAKHPSMWKPHYKSHKGASGKKNVDAQTASCALYFKKIDFISKTLDEEISADIKAEAAKPAEAEIFSYYKNESEEIEVESPSVKRRRRSSTSDRDYTSPPASPRTVKTRHNPFAKTPNENEESVQTSPAVCKSDSLLKVLSPKKSKEEVTQRASRLLSLKRSAGGTPHLQHIQVEVKSRFFAANVKAASDYAAATPDLSEEIDKIESKSQERLASQATLYISPPPKKQLLAVDDTLCRVDSGVESLNNDNSSDAAGKNSDNVIEPYTEVAVENGHQADEAIVLSDEDSIDRVFTPVAAMKKTSRLDSFKPQPVLRMGLTRGKSAAKSGKGNKPTKAASVASMEQSQSQTRLSMFGFHKRDSLK